MRKKKHAGFQALARKARQRYTNAERDRYDYLRTLELAGELAVVRLKPCKLSLNDPLKGMQTLTYEPDLLVVENDGHTILEEVKGCTRDGDPLYHGDARNKVLTAARAFPFWTFRVVWRFRDEWRTDRLSQELDEPLDLLPAQRKIMVYLCGELVNDLEAKPPREGYRSLHHIRAGTRLGENTVRRHCQTLKKAHYLDGACHARLWWYRAVDCHAV